MKRRRASASSSSFGPAATRLICAESQRTLDDLAPWLARTVPRATYPSDVHAELHRAPLRAIVTQMRRILPMFAGQALGLRHTGVPEVDDSFRAVVDDLADFTSDADTILVDATFGEQQGTVTLTSQFRSSTSFIARAALAHPERAGAPPPAFWKLPADADFAYFYGGVDPADFEHPARPHRGRHRRRAGEERARRRRSKGDPRRRVPRSICSPSASEYARGSTSRRHGERSRRFFRGDIKSPPSTGQRMAPPRPADAKAAPSSEKCCRTRDEAAQVVRRRRSGSRRRRMAGWLVIGVEAPAAAVSGDREGVGGGAWARPGRWRSGSARSGRTDAPAPVVRMAPLPKGIAGRTPRTLELVVYTPLEPKGADAEASASTKKGAESRRQVQAISSLHALVVPGRGARRGSSSRRTGGSRWRRRTSCSAPARFRPAPGSRR